MWPNPEETADLVTFNEGILTENFIFCVVTVIKIEIMIKQFRQGGL